MNGIIAALLIKKAERAKAPAIGEMVVSHVLADGDDDVTKDLIWVYKNILATDEDGDAVERTYPSVRKTEQHSMDAFTRGFKARMPDYSKDHIESAYNWPESLPYSESVLLPPEIVEAIFWTLGYESARETAAYFEHVKRIEKK